MADETFNNSNSPRYSSTLEDFVVAGEEETITYHNLSLIEKAGTIEFPIFNVIDDYIDDITALSEEIMVNDNIRAKYMYRPRLLCEDLYGNGELYYIILLLNGICNIKEFTMENNKLIIISKDHLKEVLKLIYKSEKSQIEQYNESEDS